MEIQHAESVVIIFNQECSGAAPSWVVKEDGKGVSAAPGGVLM